MNYWSGLLNRKSVSNRVWDPKYVGYLQRDLQRKFGSFLPIHATNCLNAHFSYCEIIEAVLRERYPQFKDSAAKICIGNVRLGVTRKHICDDEAALSFAENQSTATEENYDYHSWVSIEGLIIDPTILYFLQAKGLWHLRPHVVVATSKLTNESGTPMEYEPHKCFTKKQLSLLQQIPGAGLTQ